MPALAELMRKGDGMGEYFWAGLLVGLLIWVTAEVCFQLFRSRPLKKAKAVMVALIPASGRAGQLEQLLRQVKSHLSGGDFPSGWILVVDQGLEPEARQVALRFGGVRLCAEKDLGMALKGLLPVGKAGTSKEE